MNAAIAPITPTAGAMNRALVFDREKALGMRLNVPAGSGIRFEPGEEKQVTLVAFGGLRRIFGHQAKVNGDTRPKL